MKKLFFRAATIMLLAAALTACSRDYWEEINATTTAGTQDQQLNAYMSFSFEMPNTDTRAATAPDGQDGDEPSFNHVGVWGGKDIIQNATIYVTMVLSWRKCMCMGRTTSSSHKKWLVGGW